MEKLKRSAVADPHGSTFISFTCVLGDSWGKAFDWILLHLSFLQDKSVGRNGGSLTVDGGQAELAEVIFLEGK